jgi:hypothetical protein
VGMLLKEHAGAILGSSQLRGATDRVSGHVSPPSEETGWARKARAKSAGCGRAS